MKWSRFVFFLCFYMPICHCLCQWMATAVIVCLFLCTYIVEWNERSELCMCLSRFHPCVRLTKEYNTNIYNKTPGWVTSSAVYLFLSFRIASRFLSSHRVSVFVKMFVISARFSSFLRQNVTSQKHSIKGLRMRRNMQYSLEFFDSPCGYHALRVQVLSDELPSGYFFFLYKEQVRNTSIYSSYFTLKKIRWHLLSNDTSSHEYSFSVLFSSVLL